MTVCALKEVFKTLAYHREDPKLKIDDKQHLEKLEADLAKLTDMHQLFVLLIRYSSENASYLKDIILINHLFLVLLEKWKDTGYLKSDYKMFDLIQNFATTTVMKKFSSVLSNFVENGHTVNNCIFTMMHHVAGDCGQSEVLLQSSLLKTFLEIWDNKFYVTQETNDLMEYVMQQFVSKAENDPMSCALQMFGESSNETPYSSGDREAISSDGDSEKGSEDDRTENYIENDEEDILVMLFSELQDDPDPIGKIVERFDELGIYKSKSQIMEQLSKLDWIDDEQDKSAASGKDKMGVQKKEEKSLQCKLTDMHKDEIVPYCVQKLKETGKSKCLHWLQEILCEVAYVKLDSGIISKKEIEQPVPKFYTLQQKSVPLVLFSDQQEELLKDPYFFTLIQYLGFHTPEDVGMLFPRIPHFWSPDMLLDKAKQLGPIEKDKIKFDVSAIKDGQEFQEFAKPYNSNVYRKADDFQSLKNINDNGIDLSRVPGAMWIDAIQVYNNQRNSIMDVESDGCCDKT
ncbi:hypothetical protein KUTeg_011698 [Tegillarca granosa]|uniref:Timeless C-terminal domain-containing protein n=1 Tax=Tegillarca granosa TaxID=220873 RepID=A0ABQ9EXD3_TEGGR|nr:hypothetical protein KUTeg_011698 [Tegillarca granosa]